MNDRLTFRAISTQDFETSIDGIQKGNWVTGYYYYCTRRQSGIIVTRMEEESGGVGSGLVQVEIEVNHKTVRQCTGLKDKNDKLIFEGDIICDASIESPTKEQVVKVIYHLGAFMKEGIADDEAIWRARFDEVDSQCWRVCGNIYENPELIEDLKTNQ